MKRWDLRAHEIAYLLNPAFCARIVYTVVQSYCEISRRAFPFPLVYLILPLILHKETRGLINSRTKLFLWIQKYPELLIDFPKRTKELVPFTNEAVEFLLQTGNLALTLNGELEVSMNKRTLSKTKFVDDEIKDCIRKCEHVAKWFANAGKVETIYIELGVRP